MRMFRTLLDGNVLLTYLKARQTICGSRDEVEEGCVFPVCITDLLGFVTGGAQRGQRFCSCSVQENRQGGARAVFQSRGS